MTRDPGIDDRYLTFIQQTAQRTVAVVQVEAEVALDLEAVGEVATRRHLQRMNESTEPGPTKRATRRHLRS